MIAKTLHTFETRIIRAHSGILRVFARVPVGHELHGIVELSELTFALDWRVTYSGGGAHGWWIAVNVDGSWAEAETAAASLARQLAEFGRERISGEYSYTGDELDCGEERAS